MIDPTRLLLRLARWIAGRERAGWIDAMAAEAGAIEGDSTAWAVGCLWASAKDRAVRDSWFLLAILFVPILAVSWKTFVFFGTASLLAERLIPDWLTLGLWIASPFPIAVLFGRIRQGLAAYVALAISFAVAEFFPFLLMWIKFGMSPLIWFGSNVNWYKAGDDGLTMGPALGLTCDLLVWLFGAWLGMRAGRNKLSRFR